MGLFYHYLFCFVCNFVAVVVMFIYVQGFKELYGCDRRGQGPSARSPSLNGHLLRRLLYRLPILLRQYIRRADNHHVPGAGRERADRPGT